MYLDSEKNIHLGVTDFGGGNLNVNASDEVVNFLEIRFIKEHVIELLFIDPLLTPESLLTWNPSEYNSENQALDDLEKRLNTIDQEELKQKETLRRQVYGNKEAQLQIIFLNQQQFSQPSWWQLFADQGKRAQAFVKTSAVKAWERVKSLFVRQVEQVEDKKDDELKAPLLTQGLVQK